MLLKLLIVCTFSVVLSEKVRYDDYALYKVHPENEEDVKYLKDLHKTNDNLDFWIPPTRAGDIVSVVSPPEFRDEFEHSLKKRSIRSQLMVDNIQEAFDAQLLSRKRRDTRRQLFWNGYQAYEDIVEWFDYLAETYPDVVTVVSAGLSFEGRNITGIRISRGSGRRSFFLEGGQIGADWLSPVVLTYIVDQLVRGEDSEARAASEEFDWHIFPIVNPDGHEFSVDHTRLWIKNRRPISNGIGVDLTRNWNSHWGVFGTSFTATANNFGGLGPFSEIETRALSRYIENIGASLAGVLSFRGFGQRIVIPFAHTREHVYNYDQMLTIGRRVAGSLSVRHNTHYLVGNSLEVSDGSTGVLADWAKFRFNPPIVATYLLRDQGAWGYTLPVNQVQPSCEETYDSVLAIVREGKFVNAL